MFRALTCPSSGGKVVFTQHLIFSLSVNVCTVHWLRADNIVTDILLMNKENCALKLVDEIILYYDAHSKKHLKKFFFVLRNPYKRNIAGWFLFLLSSSTKIKV